MKDFAVFILSHGRADNVITLQALKESGYKGKTYIIVDDEDEQLPRYRELFKDSVIVFSKKAMKGTFDIGDNVDDDRVVVYARNKCHDIARGLGLKYFLELDDDYTDFCIRAERKGSLIRKQIKDINKVFEAFCRFLDVSNAYSVAFGQGGDFIGGTGSALWTKKISRKVMNTFFCMTDRPFQFVGRINEDVNCYTLFGQQGYLFFTIADIMVNQLTTQHNAGGLTDIYLDMGTYYKSFISVMYCPSCVRISTMGVTDRRIHHRVLWNNCVPKILSEKYKKIS